MNGRVVRYAHEGYVARIEINRPEVLNAINSEVSERVGQALEKASSDPAVRVVLIHGAGRAFCAGADLKALARGESVDPPDRPDWGFAGITRHWIDKPLIAAVHGAVLGGGLEVMLACDLIVADEGTNFGLPEVTRGLMAGAGGVLRLPRFIPRVKALELGLTGRPIEAREALELGLVNEIVPDGRALRRARELAELIADNAPVAVQGTKRVMHGSLGAGPDWSPSGEGGKAWRSNDSEHVRVLTSEDAIEGPRAFAEKRAPHWRGR